MIAEPWRLDRFNVFLGKGGYDYQISQSLLAIGTGGIFGRGLGNGKQKYLFLPELQNDFIFANIAEEFGFIGCVLVLALFAFVIWRGFQIAQKSQDTFAYLYTSSVMLLTGIPGIGQYRGCIGNYSGNRDGVTVYQCGGVVDGHSVCDDGSDFEHFPKCGSEQETRT